MRITSPEFENNSHIPRKFSGLGDDINPELIIEDIPPEAKSLALIVDDPDAPMGTWIHWVVFDIPVASKIDEDSIPGKQGINDYLVGVDSAQAERRVERRVELNPLMPKASSVF